MPRLSNPVLVVGAGPAGATAALSLASAGVPVRLLDRSTFPRNKPCGGGISARVLSRFPYLNSELPKISTHPVSRLHLEGPEGESAVIESDVPAALMVRRVEFDALLVSMAVRAGADLVTGADIVQAFSEGDRVRLVTRDGRGFEAETVIAADGVNSVIARRLGLNHGWPASSVALDMMEETPRGILAERDPSTVWVAYGFDPRLCHTRRTGPAEGYAYVFPKRDHVNVGLGYVLSYYRTTIETSPYELQSGFVDHLRARGIVTGESVRGNFTPFLIPVGGPLRQPGRGRVLLAGDAAGFVNAFTAEGIYYAMVSGDLAARAVIRSQNGGSDDGFVRSYRNACRREMGRELRDSVLIQRYLFADRRRIARIIRSAARRPGITRLIVEYAVGSRSYQAVRRRLLAGSPQLAFRMVVELAKSLCRNGQPQQA